MMMRKILVLGFLLLASPAWGAVAYDSSSAMQYDAVTSFTLSNYETTGSNPYLSVCVADRLSIAVTSVTYNAVGLALKANRNSEFLSNEFWHLAGPASGLHDVVVTLSGSSSGAMIAASFTGVSQGTPTGAAATEEDQSGAISVNVSVPANGMAVDCFGVAGTGHTLNVGADQTQRATIDATDNHYRLSTSATAGTNAMNWTWSPDDHYNNIVAVPLNPASAAAGAVLRRKPITLH